MSTSSVSASAAMPAAAVGAIEIHRCAFYLMGVKNACVLFYGLRKDRSSPEVSDASLRDVRAMTAPASSEDDLCCICLVGYGEERGRYCLPCGHHIHATCMLDYCLRSHQSRCPICRRSHREEGEDSDDGVSTESPSFEDEEDVNSDSNDSLPDDEGEDELPFWLRLRWDRYASPRRMKMQKRVARRLLQRACSARAPAVLKRCLDKHRSLYAEVVRSRALLATFAGKKSKLSIGETLRHHRVLKGSVVKARCKHERHLAEVLKRCQSSSTVRDYFALYPLQGF